MLNWLVQDIRKQNIQKSQATVMNTETSLPEQAGGQQWPHSVMSLSAILPMKLSSAAQVVVVGDQCQQFQMLANMVWRQNTSMPVVKVVSFKNESSQFPKTYSVETECMRKSIKQLQDLQLPEALYLIRQCLLGIQALVYKYRHFDIHSVFYGLDDSGRCKVWISEHLTQFRSRDLPLPNDDIIIAHVLKMVYSVANNAGRADLAELMADVMKQNNVSFSQFQEQLNQFANKKKVLISNFVKLETKLGLFSQSKSEIVRRTTSLQRKVAPYKVNFRYESPLPRNAIRRDEESALREKFNLYVNPRPQPICHQTVCFQKQTNLESIAKKHQTSFHDIKIFNQKPKPVQCMLSSPSKLKQKLKHSKDSTKISSLKPISIITTIGSIISCQNWNKSQKTCTSLTMNTDNVLLPQSQHKIKTGSYCAKDTENNSLIFSNSNLSEDYSIHVKEAHKQDDQYKADQSKMNFGNYNFGGLLPMPERSVKQSQQIDESLLQNHDLEQFSTTIPRRNPAALRSLIMSQEQITNSTMHNWDWQNKVMKLLTEDTANLKTSVYCGEEKKPEPLQIKLEKLGKMGREITSQIPEAHEL